MKANNFQQGLPKWQSLDVQPLSLGKAGNGVKWGNREEVSTEQNQAWTLAVPLLPGWQRTRDCTFLGNTGTVIPTPSVKLEG